MNRGVTQLARLEIRYSLTSGSGVGVRDFVAEGSPWLAKFQRKHPTVKLVPATVRGPFPTVQATYLNNRHQNLTLRYAQDGREVHEELERLAAQTGRPLRHLSKWPFPQSKSGSVQGRWDARMQMKPLAEQLAPLLQTQTHLAGLAPNPDEKETKPSASAATAAASSSSSAAAAKPKRA